MSETALPAALAWSSRGHPVLPANWPIEHRGRVICSCRSELRGQPACSKPAKHPYGLLVPNGLLDASTESWQVKLWWQREPRANLAVECTGLIVIDEDPDDGGNESIAALEREHGPLPTTWMSLTGGGGSHRYFKSPDGVEVLNVVAKQTKDPPLGRGVDVRAKGGYVIAPPSRHINGRLYAWSVDHHPNDTALAVAPPWLIECLSRRGDSVSLDGTPIEPIGSDVWSQLTRQPITEYQDMAAARIAGHLLRHNVDIELAAGLLHAWNSAWCKPPLGYHELNDLFSRICNREAARIEAELRRKR
jgi:hypothetical protein